MITLFELPRSFENITKKKYVLIVCALQLAWLRRGLLDRPAAACESEASAVCLQQRETDTIEVLLPALWKNLLCLNSTAGNCLIIGSDLLELLQSRGGSPGCPTI